MPATDMWCRSYLNAVSVTAFDVSGQIQSCTTIGQRFSYTESNCYMMEAIALEFALDLNGVKQADYNGNTCLFSKPIFSLSSIGIMSACDCSATSLVSSKMPNGVDVTPKIPENLVISPNEAAVSIEFILGYDTVSYNCGSGDGLSFCGS